MQALTSALPAITNVAKIGSTGYNLYNQFRQQQYQNKLRSLATNPAKMAEFAAGYTKPLTAGLTKSVGNEAQAYLGERGLSDSPEITQQVLAQALAPYIQQNQQLGYSNALQALGLGGGAIPPGQQQQTSMDQLASIFANLTKKGGGGIDPSSWGDLMASGQVPLQNIDWGIGGTPTELTPDLGTYYEPDYSAGM